jgi:hypothetical protein
MVVVEGGRIFCPAVKEHVLYKTKIFRIMVGAKP